MSCWGEVELQRSGQVGWICWCTAWVSWPQSASRRGLKRGECPCSTGVSLGSARKLHGSCLGWPAGRAGDGWARLHPPPASATQCTHALKRGETRDPLTPTLPVSHPPCLCCSVRHPLCSHSWTALPYAGELKAALGPVGVALVVGGGLVYSIGALVYALKRPDPLPATFGERARRRVGQRQRGGPCSKGSL